MPLHSSEAHFLALGALTQRATDGKRFDVTGGCTAKSLLAKNFNGHYCAALNDSSVTHFAMLHGDIAPAPLWLDVLYDQLQATQADLVSAVVPLKDAKGVTSTAIGVPGCMWGVVRRLTMHELFTLPETFSIEDCVAAGLAAEGQELLVNSGCWMLDLRKPWIRGVNEQRPNTPGPALQCFFTIADAVFQMPDGRFEEAVSSEDWTYSRMANRAGAKIMATRKVKLRHFGGFAFTNEEPWGAWEHDQVDGDEVAVQIQQPTAVKEL